MHCDEQVERVGARVARIARLVDEDELALAPAMPGTLARTALEGLDKPEGPPREATSILAMARQERDILERAVRTLSEPAAKADALVDEALAAGLEGSHAVTVHAKMLRLELLRVKAGARAPSLGSGCSTA